MDNFIIKDLTEASLTDFKQCFEKNGNAKDLYHLRWQFLANPEKKSFVDIAVDEKENKVAGIYAVSCVKFNINQKDIIGAQSLDTITDVDYRGTGLFINLAIDVYQKAQKHSVDLVYGFPNGNSIKGFSKRLKWKILDPVPFLIKPLRSKYFTSKIKYLKFFPNVNLSPFSYTNSKEYTLKEEKEFPIVVNEVWGKFSKGIKVAVKRDKAYLDWRYIQKPNVDYNIIHCYKGNEYLGYVVYVIKDKHEGKIAYIMELVYNLEHQKAGNALLKFAVSKIKSEKADCILSWCLPHSPNHNLFKKWFFLNFKEKYRPIELHFGACSFNPILDKVISDRNSWYISYSDSDTV